MASITSSGIGSGLDVNSLVSQLVAAERAPQEARLVRLDTKLTTEFTALSQLKGSMSAFQSALSGLKDASMLIARKATVSDDKNVAATAASNAVAGTYSVEVEKLATASQLKSAPFLGGPSSIVGTGVLTLSLGSNAFTVDIDSTSNTLAGIRDAINKATTNTGVHAAVLTGVTGSYLVVTGDKTGAANVVTVTQTGGDGGLAQLVYDPLNSSALTGTDAEDAVVHISGVEVHSATNTVTTAIDGVTLTLKKAAPGTVDTLTVSNDDSTAQDKVNSFVTAYNALATQIASLRSYDAATAKAGPLLGDAMLLNIEAQLRRSVSSPVTGSAEPFNMLASIGVAFGTDGKLALDTTKFQAAMTANSTAVSALFGSTNGVAKQLDSFLTTQLSSAGGIASRNASIDSARKDLNQRADALDVRMAAVQARYQKQFSALDALLSRMQSTSTYLTQQLAQSTSIAKSAGT
jgi:flagellar hook-associated protein 2